MAKTPKKARGFKRSTCPVANTLDVIGDKWSLLVIRDLFADKSTYSEFQESPEAIPTNILADRLNRLVEQGLVEKSPYQERPVRYAYTLTPKGRDLGPLLVEMVKWGEKYFPGSKAKIKK
ncbi:winged helix-turn-helix transcriptional regulator [Kaarinaea lacus]